MDNQQLKEVLTELQKQNTHLLNMLCTLSISNNNLYKLFYKIQENPQRAEELSARIEAKDQDTICALGKAETSSLNALEKIQKL